MNYATITNGIVSNVYVADAPLVSGDPLVTTQGIGWAYLNGVFTAPEIPSSPPLTPQQQAYQAIADGLTITSTSTPALNGTYALDTVSLSDMNGLVTGIMLNGSFPSGQSTYIYHDSSFLPHAFPSIELFKSFATAVLNFSSQVIQYAKSGGTLGSIPSNQITIM